MIVRQTTKAFLAESLKELSKFKTVDKITIKELTQNCGLTPPTFYNHFHDKYELMAWIYNQKIAESMKDFGMTMTFEDVVCRWMEIILEDKTFYLNLIRNACGQNSFRYTTNDHAIDLVVDWIKTRHKLEELSAADIFCLKFFMRATMETINDWCLGKWNYSEREMAKLIVSAMPSFLKPFLL